MQKEIKMNEQEFFNKLISSIDIVDYEGHTLSDVYLKVDDYPIFFRDIVYLDDILPNCEIYIDDNIHFIKSAKLSKLQNCVLIKKYSELEIENLYKDYLETNLEYELPNDEYATFYPVNGISYEELKSNGLKLNVTIDIKILSYSDFKSYINEIGLSNYLAHK